MARIQGRLILKLLPDGSVEAEFTAQETAGNPVPHFAKNAEAAQADLVQKFGISPAEAEQRIAELKRQGEIVLLATADDAVFR